MELYLSSINHPEWFKEELEDLHGNVVSIFLSSTRVQSIN
jgi:hypothetical protein